MYAYTSAQPGITLTVFVKKRIKKLYECNED